MVQFVSRRERGAREIKECGLRKDGLVCEREGERGVREIKEEESNFQADIEPNSLHKTCRLMHLISYLSLCPLVFQAKMRTKNLFREFPINNVFSARYIIWPRT